MRRKLARQGLRFKPPWPLWHGKSVLTIKRFKRWAARSRILSHAEVIEDQSNPPSEFGDGRTDRITALGLDQTDGEAAQAGDVLWSMASAQGTAIFIPVPVEDVVMGLDAPVIAIKAKQSGGIGGVRGVVGEAIDGLDGLLPGLLVDGVALDGEDLPNAGEIEVIV